MFCKHFLALLFWCHCYHIVLDPFLHILHLSTYPIHTTNSISSSSSSSSSNLVVDTTKFDSILNSIGSSGSSISGGIRRRGYLGSIVGAAAVEQIKVETNQIALTPGHEIVLRCDIVEYPNAKFTWSRVRQYPIKSRASKSGGSEEELKQTDQIIVNNNVLALKSPSFTDVGDYKCRVTDPADIGDKSETISVRARPYILDFNVASSTLKSAVIEEGAPLKIPCNASDEYEPEAKLTVKWYSSKYEEEDMNEVIPEEQDTGIRVESIGPTSKTLIIDKVTKDHRRYYKCQVTNGVTDNSKTILIRVKDKYTAIWPAVGIVIELVILIGVIFIVENRKVEPDKDVYDRKAIQM